MLTRKGLRRHAPGWQLGRARLPSSLTQQPIIDMTDGRKKRMARAREQQHIAMKRAEAVEKERRKKQHAILEHILQLNAESGRAREEEQRLAVESRKLARLFVAPAYWQRTQPRAIPRRIVQSWVDRNLTPGIQKLCESHRGCNPGYEYVFYDDKECHAFIREHFHENVLLAYDALIPGAFKADLFRYCELYVNGGWWFDIDMLSVGSIDAFVRPEIEFACPRDIGGDDDDPALYQALLGGSKGNKVLEKAIREVVHTVANFPTSVETDALAYTGPKLLARCATEVIPGCSARPGRNAWTNTRTAVFGESRMSDGFCILGGGVICIGHREDLQTPAQAEIQRLYTELRRSLGSGAGQDYRDSWEDSSISLSAPRPSVVGKWEIVRSGGDIWAGFHWQGKNGFLTR